ncbi:retrovirus-related pol polyprotein from transposon TNT 1-94 [Tanacetum coccineum]
MPLTFQPYSPKERPGLGIMKHTKPETQDSSNKCVSGTVIVSEIKQTTPSVPTEVNSNQKTQESNLKIQKTESSKSVDSSRMSQDSKPKVQNTGSSKILYCMICKRKDHRTLDHEMYIASLKRSENYKAQPYQYASSSKQILKVKAKPFPPCTHYGHSRIIQIRGGELAESSQSNESSIGVKCDTCGSTVHSTTNHNEFDHFKRCEKIQARHIREPIWKCLHLLHMDLFRPVSSMSINHEKYTLVIVDEYSRMVENQNDVKVKQIRTDNGTEFINHEIESFCDEKGISQNFSSPYTPKQNGAAERKNITLIEAARTILNGLDFISKAFRVFNTRRQQVEETYHVTFNESMEAIRFTNTLIDEIGIDDSSRYPPDEFLQEDDPFRQYQVDSDVSYYIILHGCPPNLINTKGTHEQNVKNDQMITQPTDIPLRNNNEVSDGDPSEGMLTRFIDAKFTTASASECLFANFLSKIEPKKVSKALKHPGWIDSMQQELNQFYKNKEERIYYNETFVLVARMEAIRIFLAFATYMNFKVYQMDVKSTFLNGKLEEEVYVKQPLVFESSEFPNYVCKLDKALYRMKQTPRAWYEALSTFLIQNKFTRRRIDNTLFIYKSKGDVLLVQVYVYDIIFGSTSYKLCKQFEKLMIKKFEMSMMGNLTYFLRLQIKQYEKGILICQEQYTRNLLKKYEISDSSSVKTPMVPPNNLGPDLAGKPVNETSYKGMIGSLMYLTATRPDIQLFTVLCDLISKDIQTQTMLVVIWIEEAPQVPIKYLVENWFVRVPRNSSQWLCPQLRLNMFAIAISNNPVLHLRTKHIDIRYHFIRDHILKGDIELHFIPTKYQLADIFTKPLDEPTFTRLKAELGMLNID